MYIVHLNMKTKNMCIKTLNLLKNLILILFTMSIFSNYIYADNLNWWSDSFESRKNITITNTGNSTLTDFVVYLNISKELNMQTNYNDLRFTNGTCVNSSNSIFNEYEIEYYNTNQATVWMKISNFTSIGF